MWILHIEPLCAGWPDYPYASLIAMVTVICVLALEHVVSRAYERRLTRQLTCRAHNHGEEAGAAGSDSNALVDMNEKELAQRDAHIRSFAIAQVAPFPHSSLKSVVAIHWPCIGLCCT